MAGGLAALKNTGKGKDTSPPWENSESSGQQLLRSHLSYGLLVKILELDKNGRTNILCFFPL